MTYTPGLHLLAEFSSANLSLLQQVIPTEAFFQELISTLQLNQLGSVYHQFDGGGFTAVVCLTESHLAIHTWPEFGKVTVDVFLSNNHRINDEKTREIMRRVLEFYEAGQSNIHELQR